MAAEAFASVYTDVSYPGNERLGIIVDVSPEFLAKYRDDSLPWNKRVDVRIIYGEQVLEMTFAEFFEKVGIEP